MSDPLDKERRQIDERLSELRPLVEEYRCLRDVMAALGPVEGSRDGVSTSGKRTSRGEESRPRVRAARGELAARALSAVREHPGITIPELAGKVDAKPAELYRILQEMKREGKMAKRGRGWLLPSSSRPRAARQARGGVGERDRKDGIGA